MIESNVTNLQFYPTPPSLALKAWGKFQNHNFVRVLEPSAGEGHLIEAYQESSVEVEGRYYRRGRVEVDCIEIDITKHPILRAKGLEVIGIDFFQYQDASMYSHILLNPPFQTGAQHVLHAWDIIYDGEIVAILNAETLKNPFSKERQLLARLVAQHGSVEYLQEEFLSPDAERKTAVEIALVYLRKESGYREEILGNILDGLKQDDTTEDDLASEYREINAVMLSNTVIENAVIAFKAATAAAKEAVFAEARAKHYAGMLGDTMERMNGDGPAKDIPASLAEIKKDLHKRYKEIKNRAWAGILRSSQVTSRLSSAAQKRLESEFESIKQLDFTISNIYGFLSGLVERRGDIQIEMACDVFDLITRYHSDNTVYYMGWKSNDKHRTCGMRIKTTRFILPNHTNWGHALKWESMQMLRDFDKVFAMMDGKYEPEVGLEQVFTNHFKDLCQGSRLSSSYFDVRYYPGVSTIHFFARDKKLVDRFNRFVGRHRSWIPPEGERVSEDFWLQFEQAEKMDREVRAEVSKLKRSRWDDPLWQITRDNEDGERARSVVGDALAVVLEHRGINVQAMLDKPEEPEKLLLCA